MTLNQIPKRIGAVPNRTYSLPQMQLDQQPAQPFTQQMLDIASQWQGVTLRYSQRAPLYTVGLFLEPEQAKGKAEAFMLATEFAHFHPEPDFSLHLTVPEPYRSRLIEQGWAVPHPMAGQPTVSPLLVLLYAPRDAQEMALVMAILHIAYIYARTGEVLATEQE